MTSPHPLPSNRSFGLLFTGVFAFMSAFGVYSGAKPMAVYGWLTAGGVVALITLFAPGVLTPFNRGWMKLGELLGRVVSPLVLGLIFFGLLTPIAVIARFMGRDELRLKRTLRPTYWLDRDPPGPAGDSFKNQF